MLYRIVRSGARSSNLLSPSGLLEKTFLVGRFISILAADEISGGSIRYAVFFMKKSKRKVGDVVTFQLSAPYNRTSYWLLFLNHSIEIYFPKRVKNIPKICTTYKYI